MSASEKISQVGSGVKNLAIGVAVAAAVGVVVYALVKGKKIVEAAKEAGGFVFGTSQTQTLGTWLYEKFSSTPTPSASATEAQEVKTCNAILRAQGRVISPRCQQLLRDGKLTRPVYNDGTYGGD